MPEKKVFLIVIATILISVTGNCQWFNRQYGVTNINQLSHQQLNEALKKTNGGIVCGITLSVIGIIGIVGSSVIIQDSNNSNADIGKALEGIGLMGVSITVEITGLIIGFSRSSRVKSIKEGLKNKEVSIGLINYPTDTRNLYNSGSLPCLSLTMNF